MSKTINLRTHRKRKQRDQARQQGAEQRAIHGRTAQQKQADAQTKQDAERLWSAHRREPDSD